MDSTSDNTKIMLFTNSIDRSPKGGRELLCKLNYDLLRDIYGDDVVLCEVPKAKLQGIKSLLNAFKGRIDGLNDSIIDNALQTLRAGNISKLFVDGSGFGGFVKIAKYEFPHIEIITFFHNVEARFFLGSLRSTKTVRALAVLAVNYLAERKAVRYSDDIVCLSNRDSYLLKSIYGREATHISAMAMHDKAENGYDTDPSDSSETYVLFVGGGFYANQSGIRWFVKNVVPRIDITTYIVGRGLDDLKTQLEPNEKVVLIGSVDSLAVWYRNALLVVAPIFDGSGMKTKVAEALMFGKKIVGTPEAFSGYEPVVGHAGWECTTADEFVAAIKIAQDSITDLFNPELRAIYDDRYSYAAARSRLAQLLCAT